MCICLVYVTGSSVYRIHFIFAANIKTDETPIETVSHFNIPLWEGIITVTDTQLALSCIHYYDFDFEYL